MKRMAGNLACGIVLSVLLCSVACSGESASGKEAATLQDEKAEAETTAVPDVAEVAALETLDVQLPRELVVETAGEDALPETGEPALCNSAAGELPEGLVELARDDGGEFASVAQQVEWTVLEMNVPGATMYEATRFDLEHPAVVHGFSILYGHLPEDPDAALQAGVYPDLGNNGFDFWQFDPLWQGSRCRQDAELGQRVTYVLPEPLVYDHPGPVWVAHLRQDESSPAWGFDLTIPEQCEDPSNCCGSFDICASAWNFPEVINFTIDGQPYFNWNGLSMSFAYDYMVRLYVEYTDDVTPEEHFFKKVEPGPAPGVHFAFSDFDDDGWEDMLGGTKLYRNVEGEFEDVSQQAGLADVAASGGAFGDYDNDGCLDLIIYHESYTAPDRLFHSNCDGTFTETTAESGITDEQTYNLCTGEFEVENGPSNHAAWVDIDGDSYLDLYVTNYICWNSWKSYPDNVWHNNGDGTFTEWMGTHGFWGPDLAWYSGRGANPIDLDFDGDVDIYVNNYHLHRNLFYRNNGDGTVTEKAMSMGLHGHADNFGAGINYGHSTGTSWGDLDLDGDWDVVVANLAHPRFYNFSDKTQVLIQGEDGKFVDIQGDWSYPMGQAGIRYQEGHYVPVLGDFDQDGILDLAISSEYSGRPTDFYWGLGDGTFLIDTYHAGIKLPTGNCMAASDFDHDGDLDIATRAALWRNELSEADKGNWIQFAVRGTDNINPHAIGATLKIHAGETTYLRYVNGGTGQGCQDSMYIHVGLADATQVDKVEVLFPYNQTVTFPGPFPAGQRHWLTQDGKTVAGWQYE